MQRYENVSLDVLQNDIEAVLSLFVAVVVQHQIAIAVGERDLEGRFNKESSAPACVLLRRVCVGSVKGGPFAHGSCRRNLVRRCQSAAKVKLLQLTARVYTEDVGNVSTIEPENLAVRVVANRSGL